jgi:hypothetical protein
VRVFAAIGSLLFAYMALIPGALVGANLDPGCEAGCGFALPITVFLAIAFGACALALAASAISLAAYAARPDHTTGRLVSRSLAVSALTVGVLLFSELALVYPVAAAVIAAASVVLGLLITRAPSKEGTTDLRQGSRPRAGRRREPA